MDEQEQGKIEGEAQVATFFFWKGYFISLRFQEEEEEALREEGCEEDMQETKEYWRVGYRLYRKTVSGVVVNGLVNHG